MTAPVAVLGAGIAGLATASELKRRGVPVIVFEAAPQIAGLCQSFADDEGFTYDFGAHFVTNRLAKDLGIADQCRDVPRYGESVWLNGKVYSYPFGLLRVPRFAMGGMMARVPFGRKPIESAADWFRSKYGRALADEVALPLLEAWSGLPADQLSSAVGESMPGSIFETLRLTLARRWTGKAIAIGYSRELPHGTDVWHVYPKGGLGLLCETLAKPLGQEIRTRCPAESIEVRDGQTIAVRAGGERHEVSAVVSTAPVNCLSRIVTGSDALAPMSKFKYRPMVFVNIRLEGRELLPDVVLWTPESKYPFFRLTEVPLAMPWLAPEGKTIITVDIGANIGDAIWTMDDEALGRMCIENLKAFIPDAATRYLGCRVLRTPCAYPVFAREYEADRQRFEQSTGIDGLYSVGRNGEFKHSFMEDVYVRSVRTAVRIADRVLRRNNPTAKTPPEERSERFASVRPVEQHVT
ncbi:MAG: FAD-dependent oxidoreductase [Gemmataceae bacterium]